MICPYCSHEKTEVVATVKGFKNERFRKCLKCHRTFQTVEAVKFDDYWKEHYEPTMDEKEKK